MPPSITAGSETTLYDIRFKDVAVSKTHAKPFLFRTRLHLEVNDDFI